MLDGKEPQQMARKIDYFGTFLDKGAASRAEPAGAQAADPAKDVLRALRGGGLPGRALVPLVGNLTDFLDLSARLVDQGYVQKGDDDMFALTERGREIAAVME
jgi:hypothetical protein